MIRLLASVSPPDSGSVGGSSPQVPQARYLVLRRCELRRCLEETGMRHQECAEVRLIKIHEALEKLIS